MKTALEAARVPEKTDFSREALMLDCHSPRPPIYFFIKSNTKLSCFFSLTANEWREGRQHKGAQLGPLRANGSAQTGDHTRTPLCKVFFCFVLFLQPLPAAAMMKPYRVPCTIDESRPDRKRRATCGSPATPPSLVMWAVESYYHGLSGN